MRLAFGVYSAIQNGQYRSAILIVQQSNCFLIVEQGVAFDNMTIERELSQSGEMRSNSNSLPKIRAVPASVTYSIKLNLLLPPLQIRYVEFTISERIDFVLVHP
jgi:hypothetical protein